MSNTQTNPHSFLHASRQMLRFAWDASRRHALLSVLFSLFQSLLPVAAAWLLKLLLDSMHLNANMRKR
jgi:hypothetical protein